MKIDSLLKKALVASAVVGLCWLALVISHHTRPAVVLHYAADAKAPVIFFFMENDDTIKEYLHPGASLTYRTERSPGTDYYLSVSLPVASRDSVELKPPFSRVDVYIGPDTKITRTVVSTDFWSRFSTE